MDPARLMRRCGIAVAALHTVAGASIWLAVGLPGSLLLFGPCALLSLGVSFAVAPLLRPPPSDGGDGGRPAPPPEPPWWPEFERAFRAYERRVRTSA
jgi:hypothetical protein